MEQTTAINENCIISSPFSALTTTLWAHYNSSKICPQHPLIQSIAGLISQFLGNILAMQRLSLSLFRSRTHDYQTWSIIWNHNHILEVILLLSIDWDLILISFLIQSNQSWGTWYQVQLAFWNVFSLKKCLHFRKNTLYPLGPISPATCCTGEVKFYFFPILTKLHLPLQCEMFTLPKVYKIMKDTNQIRIWFGYFGIWTYAHIQHCILFFQQQKLKLSSLMQIPSFLYFIISPRDWFCFVFKSPVCIHSFIPSLIHDTQFQFKSSKTFSFKKDNVSTCHQGSMAQIIPRGAFPGERKAI